MAGALRVLATCDVAAITSDLNCGFKLHATETLSLGVDTVNDTNDDGSEGGLGVGYDLAGGIAFVDDQNTLTDAGVDTAIHSDEVARWFSGKILFLDDQHFFAGIGNIYANDALFLAEVDPRRKGKTLTDEEAQSLFKAIHEVIKNSLNYGGSSDENFVNVLGQEGNYQNHTLVYGKKGEKCSICGATIEKIQLGGRGTYFCPRHQK